MYNIRHNDDGGNAPTADDQGKYTCNASIFQQQDTCAASGLLPMPNRLKYLKESPSIVQLYNFFKTSLIFIDISDI